MRYEPQISCDFGRDKGFDVKWVDDTHAIGVFSSTVAGTLLTVANIDDLFTPCAIFGIAAGNAFASVCLSVCLYVCPVLL